MLPTLLLINFTSCLLMTGIIWLIQLVHYPSFKFIGPNQFLAFENYHCQRMGFLVIPPMLIEILSSIALAVIQKDPLLTISCLINILIWISTFIWSAPLHKKLSLRRNEEEIHKLVSTNWPRTILWSARSILLLFILGSFYEL